MPALFSWALHDILTYDASPFHFMVTAAWYDDFALYHSAKQVSNDLKCCRQNNFSDDRLV